MNTERYERLCHLKCKKDITDDEIKEYNKLNAEYNREEGFFSPSGQKIGGKNDTTLF